MIQFAVGYQLPENLDDSFVGLVRDYRDRVAEVYFPWGGDASGRAALGRQRGLTDWTAQARLEDDLRALRALGIELDLLFNANCYGAGAVSQALENHVGSVLAHLQEAVGGVDIVTTTSPMVAHVVRTWFPEIEIRASVNMRIGTIAAMQHLGEAFDSFYLQRDRQRDLAYVREVKAWCDGAGKKLCLLANSGCLRHCPAQTFHANLVAHDAEVDERRNVTDWNAHLCRRLYADRANWPALLQSTWIRPEDTHHYDGLCHVVKLATRMHQRPRMVLHAYCRDQYRGNLLDLLEPGHGPDFAPYALLNDRLPDDWFEQTSTCDGRCHACDYCEEALKQALVCGTP